MQTPSPEQIAALLAKYKATTERVVRERDALAKAMRAAILIAESDWDFPGAHPSRKAALRDMKAALSVTRPERGEV